MNTYAKLQSGDWGIRGRGMVAGAQVMVTKRDGSVKTEVIARILWTGQDGTQLAKIAPRQESAPATPVVAPVTHTVGSLDRLIAMFDLARTHLKFPKIRLTMNGQPLQLSIAGSRSKNPGSIYVTDGGKFMQNVYFGRIDRNGEFSPAFRTAQPAGLVDFLRRMAQDPEGVASEFGRLTGACCFCNRRLTDERSTAVGYGPDCAEHYGLSWGTKLRAAHLDASNPSTVQYTITPDMPPSVTGAESN